MPAPFLHIDMLPATYGDCLWVEYGRGQDLERILIDGGPIATYPHLRERIDALPDGDKGIERVVLTPVDADHIEGLIRLFADKPLPFRPRRVWFNGWRQMRDARTLGALQGEFLSALLVRRVSAAAWSPEAPPWMIPDEGALPVHTLAGGMRLTLLSPDANKLERMAAAWEKQIKGFEPGDLDAAWEALGRRRSFLPDDGLLGTHPDLDALLDAQFTKDRAAANGSSIAFLAEFEGKSALFLADAHPDLIHDSLVRLCEARGVDRLRVDAVKISHHGSRNNTSEAMLRLIDSPRYLISTNGDRFDHPDEECLARIIEFGKPESLHFNYDSDFTRPWTTRSAQQRYGYVAHVRADDEAALRVSL
jgi:hypothetical protein